MASMFLNQSQPQDSSCHYVDHNIMNIQIADTGVYTYVGYANPGSATSAAVWKVIRITDATGVTEFADGNCNFDNVYDDRATLSYS